MPKRYCKYCGEQMSWVPRMGLECFNCLNLWYEACKIHEKKSGSALELFDNKDFDRVRKIYNKLQAENLKRVKNEK